MGFARFVAFPVEDGDASLQHDACELASLVDADVSACHMQVYPGLIPVSREEIVPALAGESSNVGAFEAVSEATNGFPCALRLNIKLDRCGSLIDEATRLSLLQG